MVADTDILPKKRIIEHLSKAKSELFYAHDMKCELSETEEIDISQMIEWLNRSIQTKEYELNRTIEKLKAQHDKMIELIITMQIDPTYVTAKDLFSEELWYKIERGPYVPDVIFRILKGHWQGKNNSQIAKELGISTNMVNKWIMEAQKDGFFDRKRMIE